MFLTGLISDLFILAVVLMFWGVIFIIIEMFLMGFGVFGLAGVAMMVAGIVLRLVERAAWWEVCLWLLLLVGIVVFALWWISRSGRNGFFSRTPLVETGTAVGVARSEGTKDFSALVGKSGSTKTYLRPIGKAEIDGEVYDVVSDGAFIENNTAIVVVSVEGQKIVVKESK